MLTDRGEPIRLDITGGDPLASASEHLVADFDSIAPEAACTSMQLHLQVPPEVFPAYWNAAQCLAGVQLALGANSPFLLGARLWAETRIPLFEQSCDVRPPELRNQGVRPRVWFGERWISSVLDLFGENSRYFPGLIPMTDDVDPIAELDAGRIPALSELKLHNGTVWRWNRPVYDIANGLPHIRLENRVLPAGPTPVDMVANALFFYGLLRVLVEAERPLWSYMSFDAAHENFTSAARNGLDATLYWPGTGWIHPDELVLRKLLPMAAEGLARWGVAPEVCDRYLPVVEQRCLRRRTGAAWQVAAVEALEDRGASRTAALHGMFDPIPGALGRERARAQLAAAVLTLARGRGARAEPGCSQVCKRFCRSGPPRPDPLLPSETPPGPDARGDAPGTVPGADPAPHAPATARAAVPRALERRTAMPDHNRSW